MALGLAVRDVIPDETDSDRTAQVVGFWSSGSAGRSTAHSQQIRSGSVLWVVLAFFVALSWDKEAVEVSSLQPLLGMMRDC